jgi:hypothetical protein
MRDTAIMAEVTPLGIGGPTSSAWREEMLTRAEELSGLASWIRAHPQSGHAGSMPAAIHNHLNAARRTAEGSDANPVRRELLERRAGLDADLLRGRLARRSASVHPAIRCPGRCVGPEQPREHAAD